LTKGPILRAFSRTFRRDEQLLRDYVYSSIVGGAVAWTISGTIPREPNSWAERHSAALISSAGLFASTVFFIVKRSMR